MNIFTSVCQPASGLKCSGTVFKTVIDVSLSPPRLLIFHALINLLKCKHSITFFLRTSIFTVVCYCWMNQERVRIEMPVFNILHVLVCVRGSVQEAICGNVMVNNWIYCSASGSRSCFLFSLAFFLHNPIHSPLYFLCVYVCVCLCFHVCLLSRCFGLLLSPGKNVKNSDMHLLDLVGDCFFFSCVCVVACLHVFAYFPSTCAPSGVNGKELGREVLHHHGKLEPQHASVPGCE